MIIINSYSGINIDGKDILFGMTIKKFDEQFNDFIKDETQKKEGIIKLRNTNLSLTFENKVLKEISILDNVNVIIKNITLFKNNDILEELNREYTKVEKYGFVIYDAVGIALSGFIENEGQRTVTVYSKNYWDEIINS